MTHEQYFSRVSALGQTRTPRSNRNVLRDTRTIRCPELVVASRHKLRLKSWRFIRMPRIERRCWVIFYSELNLFSRCLACDFGNDAKAKIYTSGHTTSGNYISIFHYPCLFVRSSHERQKIRVGPVRRSPPSFQKT